MTKTNKTKRLEIKCASYKPLDGRVLVEPLRVRSYKTAGHRTEVNIDEEGNPILDEEGEATQKMIEQEGSVNYRYQIANVLAIPTDETRFEVGDTVVYEIGNLMEFDLIKGVSMIRKFNVVAVA